MEFVTNGTFVNYFWSRVKFSRIKANLPNSGFLVHKITVVTFYMSSNLQKDWQIVENRWVRHPTFSIVCQKCRSLCVFFWYNWKFRESHWCKTFDHVWCDIWDVWDIFHNFHILLHRGWSKDYQSPTWNFCEKSPNPSSQNLFQSRTNKAE